MDFQLVLFNRRYSWNSLSLQMHFRQISHATLLYSSWRVGLYIWWALVIWSSSYRSPHPVGSGAQCRQNEICWGRWITRTSSPSTWLSNRSLLPFSGVVEWGSFQRSCIVNYFCSYWFLYKKRSLSHTAFVAIDVSVSRYWMLIRCYSYTRFWKQTELKSPRVMCIECISWVLILAANHGISLILLQNK